MAGARRNPELGRSGLAVALCAALLPQLAGANQGDAQSGASGQLYNPSLALAPGFAPGADNFRFLGQSAPIYRSLATVNSFSDDPGSLSFDIGRYDAMWDDAWFSEIAAYGGLARDLERVSSMQAMGGADSSAIPYGRLTLEHEFLNGQDQIRLGGYGLHADVQPTAISGFGDDGYTDVAVDATWRWTAHPEHSASDAISVHALVLHEGESLMASNAVFDAGKNNELTVLRGDVSYASGTPLTPSIRYFQITGTSDPVRLGTLDGSPDSKGWVAGVDYAPKPDSPLARLNVHLGLQFIAYSEFDGVSGGASQNDTVLLHLTVGDDGD
ncbi:MAG TPA: hypothetical protein VKR31_12580 [Rhizomicrobium sp.]|nr:hypothetical protein [Rhizomicrobium sp.]